MMRKLKMALVAAAASLALGVGAQAAHADWDSARYDFVRNPGVGIAAGGGVTGFVQSESRDQARTGGTWNGRVSIGTNTLFGIEGQYVGSAQQFNGASGALIGNSIFGDLRLNLGTFRVQPFFDGGVGYEWLRTSGTNSAFAGGMPIRSGGQVTIPVGAGLAAYLDPAKHIDLDVRFNYNPGTKNNLIGTGRTDQYFATANLGYVF